jgi:GrpB-like predicted nucleotidyltransferase (UPF0157 family)
VIRKVILVEYDAKWAEAFAQEKKLLEGALGTLALDIQHVGSTAVPAMAAKPIIDIAIAVAEVPIPDKAVEAVVGIGYEHKGEHGVAGRHYFSRLDRHVHVVAHNSTAWIELLLFRDFLLGNPEVVEEYVSLKRELARRHDREAYTAAKAPFVIDVIGRARARLAGKA